MADVPGEETGDVAGGSPGRLEAGFERLPLVRFVKPDRIIGAFNGRSAYRGEVDRLDAHLALHVIPDCNAAQCGEIIDVLEAHVAIQPVLIVADCL